MWTVLRILYAIFTIAVILVSAIALLVPMTVGYLFAFFCGGVVFGIDVFHAQGRWFDRRLKAAQDVLAAKHKEFERRCKANQTQD